MADLNPTLSGDSADQLPRDYAPVDFILGCLLHVSRLSWWQWRLRRYWLGHAVRAVVKPAEVSE